MNRRQFVASWSRKIFFGFCWPVMCVLGLAYFQSYSVPQSFLAWIYYILTHIGQFGLITSVLYFILYLPFVLIFPSYYFSRIWIFFLILTINALLLADIGTFFQYKLHLNKLIFEFLLDGDFGVILGNSGSGLIFSFVFLLIIAVAIWFRGERTWKIMQGRFSNPVKNWYLLFILVSLLFGQLIYNSAAKNNNQQITRLGAIFPFHWPILLKDIMQGKRELESGAITAQKDFKYTQEKLVCSAKNNKNIVLIEIDHFRFDENTTELTPFLSHYQKHGKSFNHHYSGGNDYKTGLISLIYSIPSVYMKTVEENKIEPLIFSEMKNRNYLLMDFSSNSSPFNLVFNQSNLATGASAVERNISVFDKWKSWSDINFRGPEAKPFFAQIKFESHPLSNEQIEDVNSSNQDLLDQHKKSLTQIDILVNKIISDIQVKGLLKNTVIIITGISGIEFNDNQNDVWGTGAGFSEFQNHVPMIVMWPEKKFDQTQFLTSHYDLAPTLLKDLWGCKFKDREVGYGHSLFNKERKPYILMSDAKSFGILDYQKKMYITLDNDSYRVVDFNANKIAKYRVKKEIIYESLRDLSRMFKRQ